MTIAPAPGNRPPFGLALVGVPFALMLGGLLLLRYLELPYPIVALAILVCCCDGPPTFVRTDVHPRTGLMCGL